MAVLTNKSPLIINLVVIAGWLDLISGSGLVGPNCLISNSMQLTHTDRDVTVKNVYTLINLATEVYKVVVELEDLEIASFTENFFCCRKISHCTSLARTVNWLDPLLAKVEMKLEGYVLHDVWVLPLSLTETGAEPGEGRGSPEQAETSSSTTTSTTTTTKAPTTPGQARGPGVGARVCLIGGLAATDHHCETVLEGTIQRDTPGKVKPDFEGLRTGIVHVLGEKSNSFKLLALDGDGEVGTAVCPYVTKKSSLYHTYQSLKEGGTEVLKKMLGQLNTLGSLFGGDLLPVGGCASDILQLMACEILKLDCHDLSHDQLGAIKRVCRGLERFAPVSRRNILDLFLYNYRETIDQIIGGVNILATNQNTLRMNMEHLLAGVRAFQSNVQVALTDIKSNLEDAQLKIFQLQAFSELKNFLLQNDLRREGTGRELGLTHARLTGLAGRFGRESRELVELLRGKLQCQFNRDHSISCSKSAGVVGPPQKNSLTVLSKGDTYRVGGYSYVECLPVGGEISALSGKLWLESGGYLSRGRIRYPDTCLYTGAGAAGCDGSLEEITQANTPTRLFKGKQIYYIYTEAGVLVNSPEADVVVTDRARNPIKVEEAPKLIAWSSFPISYGGEKVRRRQIIQEADSLEYEFVQVLRKYHPRDYLLHLDGFSPNPANVSSVETAFLDFKELIIHNKVAQALSATGLILLGILAAMVTVCCVRSKKCRDTTRDFVCCLCQIRSLLATTQNKINKEREYLAEYRELRRRDRGHLRGEDGGSPPPAERPGGRRLPRWLPGDPRAPRPEDEIIRMG